MFLINVPIWSSEDVFTVLNSIKEMFTFILALIVRQCVKVGEFFPKLPPNATVKSIHKIKHLYDENTYWFTKSGC